MTRERGSLAESKNCKILLLPAADRHFDTKVKCPTGRASFWVKFPTVRSLTRVKCPGIAWGWMGGFGIDWYIIHIKLYHSFINEMLTYFSELWANLRNVTSYQCGTTLDWSLEQLWTHWLRIWPSLPGLWSWIIQTQLLLQSGLLTRLSRQLNYPWFRLRRCSLHQEIWKPRPKTTMQKIRRSCECSKY